MDGLDNKIKIIVVCGPTATGKTDLAFSLCEHFGGELIGADSMQIYKNLPIGTAAPSMCEYPDIKRHLVSFLPPQQSFSVADYLKKAGECIRETAQRGAVPIVCGGTGLYIDSLVKGIDFMSEKPGQHVLDELEGRWHQQGKYALHEQLMEIDPDCAQKLHPNDKKRVIFALAQAEQFGTTLQMRNERSRKVQSDFDPFVIVLGDEERSMLYRRIEQRVDSMMQAGLLKEAQWVYQNKERFKTAVQAIGYKELFAYFEEGCPLSSCVESLKQATRRYAKRQLTWFRHHPYDAWLLPENTDTGARARALIETFLAC